MKNNFNPETLEGVSYVVYNHPDTGDKKVASWPCDGSKTHRWFIEKYPNVTILSMGIMDYDAKADKWISYFENGCDRVRTQDQIQNEITYVAGILKDRYAEDSDLKACLGQKFVEKNNRVTSIATHTRENVVVNEFIKKANTKDS